jgi:hypothetical protein
MFVPFISHRSSSQNLVARKGGGGRVGHSASHSGSDENKSHSSEPDGSSEGGKHLFIFCSGNFFFFLTLVFFLDAVSAGGNRRMAISFGEGDSKISVIPSGQIFAGRSEGGGTRRSR